MKIELLDVKGNNISIGDTIGIAVKNKLRFGEFICFKIVEIYSNYSQVKIKIDNLWYTIGIIWNNNFRFRKRLILIEKKVHK